MPILSKMRSGKRLQVGLLMGSMALVLAWRPIADASQYRAAFPAAIILIVVSVVAATQSASVRRAWGWMCVVNGVLSAMLAISIMAARGAPYEPGAGYEQEIAHAIGPMPRAEVILHYAFLGAAIAATAAFVLFGFWLLTHDKHFGCRDKL